MSRVAIVAHLYYPDISLEIVDLIEKLTFDFTLFTTGPAELPGAVAARFAVAAVGTDEERHRREG